MPSQVNTGKSLLPFRRVFLFCNPVNTSLFRSFWKIQPYTNRFRRRLLFVYQIIKTRKLGEQLVWASVQRSDGRGRAGSEVRERRESVTWPVIVKDQRLLKSRY